MWCGEEYSEHKDERTPTASVPRVPCLLLKSGFREKASGPERGLAVAKVEGEAIEGHFVEEVTPISNAHGERRWQRGPEPGTAWIVAGNRIYVVRATDDAVESQERTFIDGSGDYRFGRRVPKSLNLRCAVLEVWERG